MPFAPRIDIPQLEQYLSESHTRAQAARHFGVTPGAVIRALNSPKRTHQIAKSSIDMMGQIRTMMQTIFTQFAKAGQQKISNPQTHKTINTLTKLAAEFRLQVETVVRIADTWDQHQAIKAFQDEVLDYMEEMSPGAREAIIQGLRKKAKLYVPTL